MCKGPDFGIHWHLGNPSLYGAKATHYSLNILVFRAAEDRAAYQKLRLEPGRVRQRCSGRDGLVELSTGRDRRPAGRIDAPADYRRSKLPASADPALHAGLGPGLHRIRPRES